MKTLLLSLVVCPFFLNVSSPTPVRAQSSGAANPLVVLSLSSQDQLNEDMAFLEKLSSTLELPTWLDSLFKLYANGQDVAGLDASKPWGVVIQNVGHEVQAYGFLPVTDPELLSEELSSYISSVDEIGGEVYRVDGVEWGKQLYAKPGWSGWLFVSDDPKALANVTDAPAKLLEGLNRKYDVALRLDVGNIPGPHGKKILARLEKLAVETFSIRRVVSQEKLAIILRAASHLEQIILGWAKH